MKSETLRGIVSSAQQYRLRLERYYRRLSAKEERDQLLPEFKDEVLEEFLSELNELRELDTLRCEDIEQSCKAA